MKRMYKFYTIILMFLMLIFCFFSLDGNNVEAASYDSYYTNVDTTNGQSLISSLTKIISNGHTQVGYDGCWSAYYTTDVKPGTNYIWDMYSNENYVVGGSKQGANYSKEGDSYNREHSVPQSWFNEAAPMKSDLFHVYPTDGYVNNRRSNYVFGETENPSYTSKNGSKLGPSSNSLYSGTVFEPIDEYKGDFARTYFYMATRYSSQVGSWDGNATSVFKGSYPYLTNYSIDLFVKWHLQDPVSEKEINRNDAVQKLQKNRNPYIDHPEYVNAIWGDGELVEPAPATYTVTYSCDSDVTFNYSDKTNYVSGSLITKPSEDPVKIGFEFVGWTSNTITRELWDFSSNKITKNLTLYPLWKANSIEAFTNDCSKVTTQLLANFSETEGVSTEVGGYELVTDVSDLSVNDNIIIVNNSKSVALSTTQNKNNRGQASVTISNSMIESISSDVQVIKLEAGSVANTYAFNVGSGYLYAASSSSNYLKTQASIDANASFKIEIDSSGTASVVAQGSNTHSTLMYNNSASIFACYSSGQQAIAIYKEASATASGYEATDVAIKFNYYVSQDIYNAFADDYDFGFEYGSSYLIDVSVEEVVYNGNNSVKISIAFTDITDYDQEYSVKPVLIKMEDQTEKAYGTLSKSYSVYSLATYYLNTYSGNDAIVKKYSSLLNSIVNE